MSSFSRSSISSTSSYGPSTPYSSSPYPSSDDAHSVTTPPGSLRDYSASLKARHTLGMAAAMKSIPLERPTRAYDPMGIDNNPFDTLFSPTPSKTIERSGTFGILVPEGGVDAMEAAPVERRESSGLPPFRPALINFRRQTSGSSHTPESASTEDSFEAGGPEDYFRVYGRGAYSSFDSSAYVKPESQPVSPYGPPLSPSFYSPAPNTPYDAPLPNRVSTLSAQSSCSRNTMTSLESTDTITSLSSSTSTSTITATLGVAGTARVSRPSLLRPKPRAHPYDSPAGTGGRQRESSGGGRAMSYGEEEENMRQDGRSVSEVMVAMAGLRCQRGRAMRAG